MTPGLLRDLRAVEGAQVVGPQDGGYDVERTVWNAMVDRRPAAVVRCRDAVTVGAVVRVVRAAGLPLRVRGGGHSVAGNAVADGAVVLDLAALSGVRVDAGSRVAAVGGGARWAQVDAEAYRSGLAVTGGVVSSTGVGGLTLGGGIGWLVRRFGPTCHSLVGAEVVLADGSTTTVDLERDGDLLWALRGGGGSFGVVTQLRLQLRPVPPLVTAGTLLYPLEALGELLGLLPGLLDAPPELALAVGVATAPPHPAVPAALHGRRVAGLGVCHSGATEEAAHWLGVLRRVGGPAASLVAPQPYPQWQTAADAGSPSGLRNYWKGGYLREITNQTVDALRLAADAPSARSHAEVHLLGGAHAREPEGGAAYGHRGALAVYDVISTWEDPGQDVASVMHCRAAHAALDRSGTGETYVNYLAGDEGSLSGTAYTADGLKRLRAVKRRVDPDSVFAGPVPGA